MSLTGDSVDEMSLICHIWLVPLWKSHRAVKTNVFCDGAIESFEHPNIVNCCVLSERNSNKGKIFIVILLLTEGIIVCLSKLRWIFSTHATRFPPVYMHWIWLWYPWNKRLERLVSYGCGYSCGIPVLLMRRIDWKELRHCRRRDRLTIIDTNVRVISWLFCLLVSARLIENKKLVLFFKW